MNCGKEDCKICPIPENTTLQLERGAKFNKLLKKG